MKDQETDDLSFFDYYETFNMKIDKEFYKTSSNCGIANFSNTCFVNSILQCLKHTYILSDYCINNELGIVNNELTIFSNLLQDLFHNPMVVKPRSFLRGLKATEMYANLCIDQYDSCEFLMYILDKIHTWFKIKVKFRLEKLKTGYSSEFLDSVDKYIKKYENDYSVIVKYFYGSVNNNSTFDYFNILHLGIPQGCNIIDLFDLIKHNYDDNLWALPNILICSIKRNLEDSKNACFVKYPLKLDVTPLLNHKKGDPNNYIYSLYAINVHVGTDNNGHYYSICKNFENDWYLYNDGNVFKVDGNNIEKDACILFYHRVWIE